MKNLETEKYIFTSPKRFWRGAPHTDSIEFVESTDKIEADEIVLFDKILSPEEYRRSVEANSSCDYDIESDIRVIVVFKEYIS